MLKGRAASSAAHCRLEISEIEFRFGGSALAKTRYVLREESGSGSETDHIVLGTDGTTTLCCVVIQQRPLDAILVLR